MRCLKVHPHCRTGILPFEIHTRSKYLVISDIQDRTPEIRQEKSYIPIPFWV